MARFTLPGGSELSSDALRFKLGGDLFLPEGSEFPRPGDSVHGVWAGEVTGFRVKESDGNMTLTAEIRITSADVSIAPPPPGLFDDLETGLPKNVDPETGEIK